FFRLCRPWIVALPPFSPQLADERKEGRWQQVLRVVHHHGAEACTTHPHTSRRLRRSSATADHGLTWVSQKHDLAQRESWSRESASSICPDPELLDEWPPFLGIGLYEGAKCLWGGFSSDNRHFLERQRDKPIAAVGSCQEPTCDPSARLYCVALHANAYGRREMPWHRLPRHGLLWPPQSSDLFQPQAPCWGRP